MNLAPLSDGALAALFASIPASIASVATLVVALRASANVKKIEVATNSMKDALVKVTGDEALARGKLEGAATEKALGVKDAATLARGKLEGQHAVDRSQMS